MKVKLVNALSLPHPRNKKRTVLHHAGEVLDLDTELAERAVEYGAAERVDGDDEPDVETADAPPVPQSGAEDDGGTIDEVELPERPSNNATTEAWRAYVTQLVEVTKEELGETDVPASATRAELIQLGDTRVAEWNEG